MPAKNYSIQVLNRGEELRYKDRDVELELSHTYCNGLRLYGNDTSGERGPALDFPKRREIIENLCDYFHTRREAFIFVLDERDKDRPQLESLIANLVAQGNKLTIEYDSAEQRERMIDEMSVDTLKAGGKIIIEREGIEINTPDDYWRWKNSR